MPERQLRPLSKLKPEYYSAALTHAVEMAGDRPMTEKDVSAAVATMLLSDKSVAKRSIVDVEQIDMSEGDRVSLLSISSRIRVLST
jgi:hypothetical protein